MNRTIRFHIPERNAARSALHAIGHAPARGLATGIAMVRLVQIARLARDDDPTGALEPVRLREITSGAAAPDPTVPRPRRRAEHLNATRPAA